MSIQEFDQLETEKKREIYLQCCGSSAWVDKMLAQPPFEDLVNLEDAVDEQWYACTPEDWKEAFAHHPKIGEKNNSGEQSPTSREWSANEQKGINDAAEDVLNELAMANAEYEKKFGFIFIISAAGKSAKEMLDALNNRLNNSPGKEVEIAAEEQIKITKLRLEKLFL